MRLERGSVVRRLVAAGDRQEHGEARTTGRRIQQHDTAMRLNRPMDHRESESGPAGLTGHKRFEQAVFERRRDTWAVIDYAYRQQLTREHRGRCAVLAGWAIAVDLDEHVSLGSDSLHGIEYQVEDGAMQQIFIAFHWRQFRRHAHLDLYAVAPVGMRRGKHRGRIDGRAQVESAHARHARASKVEEIRKQSTQSIGLAHDQIVQNALVIIVGFFLALLVAGLGLALSLLFIRFDDTRNIVNVLLMILMYLTPIFYPVTVMNSTMQTIIHWNPLTSYLDIFRWAFSNNATPTMFSWIYMSIWSIFAILMGTYVFKKYWPRTVAML